MLLVKDVNKSSEIQSDSLKKIFIPLPVGDDRGKKNVSKKVACLCMKVLIYPASIMLCTVSLTVSVCL